MQALTTSSTLDNAVRFYEKCINVCKKDQYNILLYKDINCNIYTITLKNDFEQAYKAPLHFLVKPEHEFLLKMYHITNYTILDMGEIIGSTQNNAQTDKLFITYFSSIPVKGLPFINDGILNTINNCKNYPGRIWRKNFGLNEFKKNEVAKSIPKLTFRAKRKLKYVDNAQNIVLIMPDSSISSELDNEFWLVIINYFKRLGYTVVVHSRDKYFKRCEILTTEELNLTLEEIIALGYNCRYIFSLRNELNEALAAKGAQLYCFYPAETEYEYKGLTRLFDVLESPIEVMIKDYRLIGFKFSDKNLELEINNFLINEKENYNKYKRCKLIFAYNRRKSQYFDYKAQKIKRLYDKSPYINNNLELREEGEKFLCQPQSKKKSM